MSRLGKCTICSVRGLTIRGERYKLAVKVGKTALERVMFPFYDVLDRDSGLSYVREPRKVWAMVTDGPTTALPAPL